MTATLGERITHALNKQVIYEGELMTIRAAQAESDRLGRSRLSFSLWLRANYSNWYEFNAKEVQQ